MMAKDTRYTPSPWEHLRFEVYKRDGFRCVYCGWTRPEDPKKDPGNCLQIDHIIPRAEGGQDEMTNLVTSCKACNSGKWYIDLLSYAPPLDYFFSRKTRVLKRLKKLLEEYEKARADLDSLQAPINTIERRLRR